MKKFLAIVLAVVLAFACVACASGDKGDNSTLTANEGVLVMATNASFPPYEYKDGEDFAGIDVEIAGLIAEKLGLELQIKDVEFGSIIGGVQSGKFDMGMAGMTVTEERQKSVNFTTSYATGIQSVIVKADSDISVFDDVYSEFTEVDGEKVPAAVKDGIKIGVQQDTTGDIYCSDSPKNWGVGEDNVVRYKTGNDAVQALVAGKVSAVVIDNEPAKSYVSVNEGLKILDTEYVQEDYAICISKDNAPLLSAINIVLEELIADGSVQKVIDKYIAA